MARAGAASVADYPGHQGRGESRLRADRHRRRSASTQACDWASNGQGHGRGAHRAGHAHGGRRLARLLRTRPAPGTPQDLTEHKCINLRLPTCGGLYAWEFEKRGRELHVRVEGQLVFNNVQMIVRAAAPGLGWLRDGGSGGGAYRGRAAGSGAGGLVSAISGLSPLLSEPAPAFSPIRVAGGGPAISCVSPCAFPAAAGEWVDQRRADAKCLFRTELVVGLISDTMGSSSRGGIRAERQRLHHPCGGRWLPCRAPGTFLSSRRSMACAGNATGDHGRRPCPKRRCSVSGPLLIYALHDISQLRPRGGRVSRLATSGTRTARNREEKAKACCL